MSWKWITVDGLAFEITEVQGLWKFVLINNKSNL